MDPDPVLPSVLRYHRRSLLQDRPGSGTTTHLRSKVKNWTPAASSQSPPSGLFGLVPAGQNDPFGFQPDVFLSFLQEHLNYVTEISLDELYILDPELVVKETVGTSPSMPDLVDSEEPQKQFSYPCSPSSPPTAVR